MPLLAHSLSHIGRQRKRNEDYCLCDPDSGLFMVADGMGGHPAGEIASRLAIESCLAFLKQDHSAAGLPPGQVLVEACRFAHEQLQQAGRNNRQWFNMGTTLALLHCQHGMAHLANVGDSRIYLLRGGRLRQCSEDHNLAARNDGITDQLRNILTQAIGLDQPLEVFSRQFSLREGDRFLLCSDGLNGMLPDGEIALLLKQPDPPATLCQLLVDVANDRGGHDNISVIVVDFPAG